MVSLHLIVVGVSRNLLQDYLVHHVEVVVWVDDSQCSDQVLIVSHMADEGLHALYDKESFKSPYLLDDMDVFLLKFK